MKSRTFEDDGTPPSRRRDGPGAAPPPATTYGVELRPVEFRYVVVGGASDGTVASATHGGMVLASRASPAAEVLGDILRVRQRTFGFPGGGKVRKRPRAVAFLRYFCANSPDVIFETRCATSFSKAAAPDSDGECARLWRRGPCYAERGHAPASGRTSATADPGDGYEVLDADCLFPAPPLRPAGTTPSRTPRGRSGPASRPAGSPSPARASRREPPTVGRWLGLSPRGDGDAAAVVDLIVETRPSPAAAWSRSRLQLDSRIRVGDYVDAQDSARKWYEAVVREVDEDTVKVHFVGWGSKWDTTLPRRRREGSAVSFVCHFMRWDWPCFVLELNVLFLSSLRLLSYCCILFQRQMPPPAPLWTRTSKWRERIAVGDEVEIRESTSVVQRPKWHRAVVLAVGFEGEVPREIEGGAPLEVYDDGGGEGKTGRKRPLLLMGRTRQVRLRSARMALAVCLS